MRWEAMDNSRTQVVGKLVHVKGKLLRQKAVLMYIEKDIMHFEQNKNTLSVFSHAEQKESYSTVQERK